MTQFGGSLDASKSKDTDRQFEEDLERARALSLESLALEKFKQKRLEKLNYKSNFLSTPLSGELKFFDLQNYDVVFLNWYNTGLKVFMGNCKF